MVSPAGGPGAGRAVGLAESRQSRSDDGDRCTGPSGQQVEGEDRLSQSRAAGDGRRSPVACYCFCVLFPIVSKSLPFCVKGNFKINVLGEPKKFV